MKRDPNGTAAPPLVICRAGPPGEGAQDLPEHPRGLSPTVIVAYLVGYMLWSYTGPRLTHFATEPYDCGFLLVVATLLWRTGHAPDIRSYLLGRLVPRRRDLPAAVLVLSVWIGWWALCVGVGWIAVGQPGPLDLLELVDDVLTSPITEEMVYRGVILAILLGHTRGGRWSALGLSALLFAAIHAPSTVGLLLALTGAGLLLGLAYMATRCVLFCVFCHAIWNGSFYVAGRILP